jgi:hypothetical protein
VAKGFYGGGTVGFPQFGGLGGGLYFDNHENFYPQFYYGTPGGSVSAGYSPAVWNVFDPSPLTGQVSEDWFSRWIGPRS